MTEKRFKIDLDEEAITDNGEYCLSLYCFQDKGEKDVCDLLNNLHEKNQELHKTIEELDNCQKGQSHRINDLYLENKQLKDLITHLGYTIKYDGYRHISLELI